MGSPSDEAPADRRCPVCDSPGLPIMWGDPTDETAAAALRGEVVLGGCCIPLPAPSYECDAGHRWGVFGVSTSTIPE